MIEFTPASLCAIPALMYTGPDLGLRMARQTVTHHPALLLQLEQNLIQAGPHLKVRKLDYILYI